MVWGAPRARIRLKTQKKHFKKKRSYAKTRLFVVGHSGKKIRESIRFHGFIESDLKT